MQGQIVCKHQINVVMDSQLSRIQKKSTLFFFALIF